MARTLAVEQLKNIAARSGPRVRIRAEAARPPPIFHDMRRY
jgi:hypothetical protein